MFGTAPCSTQAITMGTVFAGLSDSEDDDDELYQGEEQFNVESVSAWLSKCSGTAVAD